MEQFFQGKHVAISGAGRGFGRTAAIMMARAGAIVHLSARNKGAAIETQKLLKNEGLQAFADECDISVPEQIEKWAQSVKARTNAIDYLFLNAGRWEDESELEAISSDDIAGIISSTLTGSLITTKAFLPLLKGAKNADIVAMVSSCGLPNHTQSPANPAFYAAKSGLSGFCAIMAERLRPQNIRVLGVYPSDFDNIEPDSPEWQANKSPNGLLTSRSIWTAIQIALAQPRECSTDKIVMNGLLRWDQV